jgi:hypothetical protein
MQSDGAKRVVQIGDATEQVSDWSLADSLALVKLSNLGVRIVVDRFCVLVTFSGR